MSKIRWTVEVPNIHLEKVLKTDVWIPLKTLIVNPIPGWKCDVNNIVHTG